MKTRRLLLVASSFLAIILFTAGAGIVSAETNGFSVGLDGYEVGKVMLSTNEAFIGDSISISGEGQVPNAAITVYMGGIYEEDGMTYLANLGTASTDDQGNWSFVFTIPQTVTREDDGATVEVFPAYWPVGGVYFEPDSTFYASWSDPDLLVYGERPEATQDTTYYSTSTGTTYYAATLPETGSSTMPLGLGLMGSGLVFAASAPVFWWFRNRRLEAREGDRDC